MLAEHFPHVASKPLGEQHHTIWKWAQSLKPGIRPLALIVILARGAAKSTTAELVVAWCGQRQSRRFVLYVSETQDQADKHVAAISEFLGRMGVERSLNKYGHSRGWKRNQLRCSNGFNVEALGLDTAARGIKLDDVRPDLIVLDDIDNQNDTPRTTEKKIRSLSTSIFPAGSSDCAILGVQNLILDGGVFSQLSDGSADFLRRRLPVVMLPAVKGLEYESYIDPETKLRLYRITNGTPTWEGQSLAVCEAQINDWGLMAFLREAQHEVYGADGYFFDASAFRTEALPDILDGWKFCRAWDLAATQDGGDYTVGVLMGYNPERLAYVIDVVRGQLSSDRVRKLITETASIDKEQFGAVRVHLPQDPGQAGKDQAVQLKALLDAGKFLGRIEPVTGRKSVRARGWADQVNTGNAILVPGEWNHWFKHEHRKFREDEEHEFDDQVDAAADAFNEIAERKADWKKALSLMD